MLSIHRSLRQEIVEHLSRKEMTLLTGPRQAGKTTLLKEIAAGLEGQDLLFLNLDIPKDRGLLEDQEKFVAYLHAFSGGKPSTIFIDEIQRLENAGLYLKGIYDRDLPYKFVLTGSGSLELKEKVTESLVGRKRNFNLLTTSIEEFAAYKTNYQFGTRLGEILATNQVLREEILTEYLMFGGYPAVVTEKRESDKLRTLEEIYQGYIERDIVAMLQLEKSQAFITLMRLMASRSGSIVNYSDLAKLTTLRHETIKKYLWYAEKTFIIRPISPFFTNKEKELVKAPSYYFLDIGLRNYLRGIFDDPSDTGMRFQTFVYRLLEKRFRHAIASIHFWRSKAKAEVDFVVNRGPDLLPVEVKSTALKTPSVTRSYRSFLEQYKPKEGWVVNRSLSADVMIGETIVRFIPWWELMEGAWSGEKG
ncbi:MAG: ATP-binding protein [Bacteroidia bacterium]|nr:ATP-binding protein [Bacteroidia bacterium]